LHDRNAFLDNAEFSVEYINEHQILYTNLISGQCDGKVDINIKISILISIHLQYMQITLYNSLKIM